MKKFRKLASTALALILAMALSLTAFAAGEEGDGTAVEMKLDESITVSGLQKNDTVVFYKVLGWNDEKGWVAVNTFEKVLSETEVESITKEAEITFELAGRLGQNAAKAETSFDDQNRTCASDNGSVVITGPEAGLYMAIIIPGQSGYTYNPVFVAADFSDGNNTSTVVVVDPEEGILGYSNKGSAKKSEVNLTKEADVYTHDVGDNVHFTVTTTIPLYASNYVHPVFKLTDVLSKGLQLKQDSIVVKDANKNVIPNTNYTPSFFENNNDEGVVETGYVINFTEDYLKSLSTAMAITVEYDAKVVIDDPTSISFEDNTVTLNYSNNPSDEVGAGVLRDKTNHYTFDIDGSLFGNGEYSTSDVVKIGVDANGKEIKEQVELANGKWVGALAGAKFVLYTDPDCTEEHEYTNDWIKARGEGGNVIVSDDLGHITIKGLDAGTYWLKEIEAPEGYIKAQEAVKIEIVAETVSRNFTENVEVKIGEETITVPVSYDVDVLESYTIKVNDKVTATYELHNDATADLEEAVANDIVGNGEQGENNPDGVGKIVNKQGVALPSTGGIGTTIFYIVGIALILGAGVLLVVKKRVGGKEEA